MTTAMADAGQFLGQAHKLAEGWKSHFYSADREIEWLQVETEGELWLDKETVILGRIDSFGKRPDGEIFFGEWKTANPRKRNTWKDTWRLNPQSLTYGLIARSLYPTCRRFTVRQAFKSNPPSFDHAWFSYSDRELDHWKGELLGIASEIRAYRADGARPWPTNFDHCFKFGKEYACPFFQHRCSKQQWADVPPQLIKRVSHLETERRLTSHDDLSPNVVMLDATRVREWYGCREAYFGQYEEGLVEEPGEALIIGTTFHGLMDEYYQTLIRR